MITIRFSRDELYLLRDQMQAASDPDQRTAADEALIAKIERAWLRAQRKAAATP